jgi:glucose/arabinose dehydrogenase
MRLLAGRGLHRATFSVAMLALVAGLIGITPSRAGADGITITLEERLTGLSSPVYITHAGDGTDRLFVVERGGKIKVVQSGQSTSAVFIDLATVTHPIGTPGFVSGAELGLLALAFSPTIEAERKFYVWYTRGAYDAGGSCIGGEANCLNTLASFRVSAGDANVADPASLDILLELEDPFGNHNGGWLGFGPDGYLYLTTGDAGAGGDPRNNAQNLNALFGKVLRLDVTSPPSGGDKYVIPPTNPFVGVVDTRPEIWGYGLRNPYRASIDRQTGDLWIGDVGQEKYEEINFQRFGQGGKNYGWRKMEGAHCYNPSSNCFEPGFTMPVIEFAHGSTNCAVTGGNVYRGLQYPQLRGFYFFSDFCSANVWMVRAPAPGSRQEHVGTLPNFGPSGFGEDEAGELYVTVLNAGKVFKITASGSLTAPSGQPPRRVATPATKPSGNPAPRSIGP